MNKKLEEFSNDIYSSCKNELSDILDMIKKYNFCDLLSYLALKIQIDIQEGTPFGDMPISELEYLLSLILSFNESDLSFETPSEEQLEKFLEKFHKLRQYSGFLPLIKIKDPFLGKIISDFLIVRGNNYDLHLEEYLQKLFGPYNDFLDKKLGFSVDNIIELYENSRVIYKEHPFIYKPKDEKEINVLEHISASLGDNKKFLAGEHGGLFIKDSIVPEKSVIKFKENYYIFHPTSILRNIKNIFEIELFKETKKWDKYTKHRANIVEEESIKYIENILNGSKSYLNLKYGVNNNFESDGIIIYDKYLFILESKAGNLRSKSIRGDINSLNDDMYKLMIHGYEQALRTKKYIEDNEYVEFYTDNGEKVYINKNDYNKIFLLNITGEPLGLIPLNLDIQQYKGNIDNNVNFWSVYLNDLRVISELIEFPSQFLLYLERRINKLLKMSKIEYGDELDIFMDFFNNGLYFEDGTIFGKNYSDFDQFTMDTTLTQEIDKYYWGKGNKPTMKIDNMIKRIINSIESSNKYGFSEISTFLLSLDPQDLKKQIEVIYGKNKEDRKNHSITLFYKENNILFLIVLFDKDNFSDEDYYMSYFEKKIYSENYKKGYILFLKSDLDNGDISFNNFSILENKYFKVKSIKRKIGRNEKCPCGSGIKYKKCCINS